MQVWLDGVKVAEMSVSSSKWKTYAVQVNTKAGDHSLAIYFTNDDQSATEDRNLRSTWQQFGVDARRSPSADAKVMRARVARAPMAGTGWKAAGVVLIVLGAIALVFGAAGAAFGGSVFAGALSDASRCGGFLNPCDETIEERGEVGMAIAAAGLGVAASGLVLAIVGIVLVFVGASAREPRVDPAAYDLSSRTWSAGSARMRCLAKGSSSHCFCE